MFNLTSRWQGHLKGGGGGGAGGQRAKDTDEATILPGGFLQPTSPLYLTVDSMTEVLYVQEIKKERIKTNKKKKH